MMIIDPTCDCAEHSELAPAIAVAGRQLGVLGELVQMGLEVARGQAAAALAASHAVEVILDDEIWQPETGRARALAGSKDAAEAFQKVSRALRLTLALELSTAETLGELRAGVFRPRERDKDAGGTPAVLAGVMQLEGRRPAGTGSSGDASDAERCGTDAEHLVEYDRPDRLPGGTFVQTIDHLCADLGVTLDWKAWAAEKPSLTYRPLQPRPPGWTECRPRGWRPADQDPDETAPSPASSP